MKILSLSLLLILFISASVSAQVTTTPANQEIDLRYNPEKLKKGRNQLITGFTLSAIGTGLAILAPHLVSEPTMTYSPEKYAKDLASVGSNDEARTVIVKRYNDALSKYTTDIEEADTKTKTIRGIGITGVSIGLVINISGVSNLVKGITNK